MSAICSTETGAPSRPPTNAPPDAHDTFPVLASDDGPEMLDVLTQSPNRRAAERELERALLRADQSEKLLAVCVLDVDAFRPVNDTYGSAVGDQVLRAISQRLRAALRESDFVARLGGDEFILLVEDLDRLEALESVLDRVWEQVTAPILLSAGKAITLGFSLGAVLYPLTDASNPDVLLRWADQALYEAKSHIEDRGRFWAVYGETMPRKRNVYQQLFQDGGLRVFYQPILDNRTRQVVGFEALSRLRDDSGKILPPGVFLPHLEEGDLFEMTRQVFLQACADLEALDQVYPSRPKLWVSINLDPASIRPEFLAYLRAAFATSGQDPGRFVFEILEGGEFLNTEAACQRLAELRALGVRVALDDVGSAYSSLLRIKLLPLDEIKLDQGFVRTLGERPEDLYFILVLHELAAALHVNLVLEGVETPDILDALSVLKTGYLQGYAIAKPMPLGQIQNWLRNYRVAQAEHPLSLLGVYADQVIYHQSVRSMTRVDTSFIDWYKLADPETCAVHYGLEHLGFMRNSPLAQLHRRYHQVIGKLFSSPETRRDPEDWASVEKVHLQLLEALKRAYCEANPV